MDREERKRLEQSPRWSLVPWFFSLAMWHADRLREDGQGELADKAEDYLRQSCNRPALMDPVEHPCPRCSGLGSEYLRALLPAIPAERPLADPQGRVKIMVVTICPGCGGSGEAK